MPTADIALAALALAAVIVAVIFWLIARDGHAQADDVWDFADLPDDDDIWDLAAGLGYDDGWCGRCGRHITACRADGACNAALDDAYAVDHVDPPRLVDVDDLVPAVARYCPRHATDTISLFEVPDGWMPPTGARRIAAIVDDTQALEVVSVGSPAA